MFRRLAKTTNDAAALVKLHPAELTALLEQAWNLRVHVATPASPTGHPDHRSNTPGLAVPQVPLTVDAPPALNGILGGPAQTFSNVLQNSLKPPQGGIQGFRWDHLIYAYMISNTRIRPIFRRVVHELLHGEKFGVPNEDSQRWLRNTEELFFRDSPPFSIITLTSHIRPNIEVTERQAYYRMFGMDLNHGNDDNSPFVYARAEAANKEFVTTFEELLREVWIGHINRANAIGARPTDDAKIADLANDLSTQLLARRQSGNLSREEFYLVAMMSWFHLTVENFGLPIIQHLRVEGTSPEQVLFKLAQMVNLPAHGLSRGYFLIADAISEVLTAIETGAFQALGAAPALYDPNVPNPLNPTQLNTLPATMNTISAQWINITGRDLKASKVAVR